MRAWVALAAILGAVLATQAFPTWSQGIRQQFASDVTSYEQIARAAPGLPHTDIAKQHAERFPAHWLAGTLADATGAPLHDVYRFLTALALAALLVVVAAAGRRLELEPGAQAISVALVAGSAYPFRYLLAAPGMLSDAVFVLGLGVVVLGFAEDRPWIVCAGLALATLGRQTAIPVAAVAAVLLLLRHGRRRLPWAATALATAGVLFVFEVEVARRFSQPGGASAIGMSVLGSPGSARALADHVGRTALPLIVPAAVIAGGWLRTRVRPLLAPSLLAVAVIVQPVLLAPDWVARNEPRLAGLAVPALALVAGGVLRGARLSVARTAAVAAAILAGSLHPRYTDLGVPDTAVWLVLLLVASAAIVAVLRAGPSRAEAPKAPAALPVR